MKTILTIGVYALVEIDGDLTITMHGRDYIYPRDMACAIRALAKLV